MSAFCIPEEFLRFANQVKRRFEMLIRTRVIEGIELAQLDQWWLNFDTDEEKYLAAHLLDSLVYRTIKMLESSSQYILHMILPDALEKANKFNADTLHDFLIKLKNKDANLKIRFMAVEGKFRCPDGTIHQPVAKSGPELLRIFLKSAPVSQKLAIHPDNIYDLTSDVDILVFIDDCLGSGAQFLEFAHAYDLQTLSHTKTLIYIPYVAHTDGINELAVKLPQLIVRPVEVLEKSSDFFIACNDDATIWKRDKKNTVAAVKAFYLDVLKKRGINGSEGAYCKNICLSFQTSTPNNSLKIFRVQTDKWNQLFARQN